MSILAKFGNHRYYRNGDINSYINSYMDTLNKCELTASIPHIARFFIDLQFRSPGYDWQNHKKKNAGNSKAFRVLRKLQKCHEFIVTQTFHFFHTLLI